MAGPVIWSGADGKLIASGTLKDKRNIPYLQQPEKNYISMTGWGDSGGGLTVVETTTASELPREFTSPTGLKIAAGVGISVGDYVYKDFTLDDIDQDRKLNIKWAQKLLSTYAAGDLIVYIADQSSRAIPLHTPIVSSIPAANFDFDAFGFDTVSTATLSLVIKNVSLSSGEGIVISDVIVGPGTIQAVPAIGRIATPTITWNNSTGLTPSNNLTFDRAGENLIINGLTTFTGTGSSGSAITMTLSGLTITSQTSGSVRVEETTTGYSKSYLALASSGNLIFFTQNNGSVASVSVKGTDVGNATSGDINAIYFNGVTVRIAEWSGAPNYAGSNDVEYYATGGTWDADSSTTLYGPSGATMGGALTAQRTKTITTLTPNQVTDNFELQFKTTTDTSWVSAEQYGYSWQRQGSIFYGAYVVVTGANTITVVFAQYPQPSTSTSYAQPGGAWTSSVMWRVVKTRSGAAVGFGLADSNSAGLIGTGTQSFSGAKTFLGQIKIGDGTASAPSLEFSSDSDGSGTGIYRIGANSMGFSANGTEVGRYSSAGAWRFGPAAGLSGTFQSTASVMLVGGDDLNASGNFLTIGRRSSGTKVAYLAAGSGLECGLEFSARDSGNAYLNVGGYDSAGAWTFGNGTGQIHRFNCQTNAAAPGAVVTYMRINVNGTTYKVSLLGNT